jgi:serine/threonine protein kinase
MMNKIKFPDDNTIYSFDLSDFEFSTNVYWDNICAKHIKTKKTLFIKYHCGRREFETESYFYQNLSSHPNIVENYGYGKSVSGYYIVLELHNINLEVLERIFNVWKINFPEQFLMNIIASVIKALEYIHSKGFYKKHFKSAHILFLRNGVIKLSNFEKYSYKSFQIENGSNLWNDSPILQDEKIFSNKKDKQYNDIWDFGIALYNEINYEEYKERK